MTGEKKLIMTKACGIWLQIAGAAITIYALYNLVSFMLSWGFDIGDYDHNTLSVVSMFGVIFGLLFFFSGQSIMQRGKWGLGFFCLVLLCAAPLVLISIGVYWYLALAIAFCSAVGAVLLLISKQVFISTVKHSRR